MDEHLTLNTFKQVKQIQELITEEVTELFLIIIIIIIIIIFIIFIIFNVNIIIIILIIREDKFSLCECACLEKKIFKGLHQIFYVQIVFGYYFANNVGAATIWTNFDLTYPRTISM